MIGVAAESVIAARKKIALYVAVIFFFSSRRRHTRFDCDWSSDVCSSDLRGGLAGIALTHQHADHAEATGAVCGEFPDVPVAAAAAGAIDVPLADGSTFGRSEERRVGKEGRSRWSPYH